MYRSIIARLKAILEAIQIDGQTALKTVYDYEPTEVTQYPTAIILPTSHTEEARDLRSNRRTYVFNIRIMGALQEEQVDTQTYIQTVADKVIDELAKQTNLNLSNTIDFSGFTSSGFRFVTDKSSLYIADIRYTATVCFNRYA